MAVVTRHHAAANKCRWEGLPQLLNLNINRLGPNACSSGRLLLSFTAANWVTCQKDTWTLWHTSADCQYFTMFPASSIHNMSNKSNNLYQDLAGTIDVLLLLKTSLINMEERHHSRCHVLGPVI